MKKPNTYQQLAEEAFQAYEKALEQLENGTLSIKSKLDLFKTAPVLASFNRGINGTDIRLIS